MKIKRTYLLLMMLFILLAQLTCAFAQGGGLDLGARYLKLGNTYREAGKFEKASDYLNKGKNIVEKSSTWKGKYWTATAYEFYGYLFRDIGMTDEAKEYLKTAKGIFRDLISMSEGSPTAVESAINSLQAISDQIDFLDRSAMTGEPTDVLNFDNQKLKTLPGNIPEDVKNISLAENRFTSMPAGLLRFKSLRYINLADNRIKTVPANIDDLKNLHFLDLSGNRLKEIPASLGAMAKLRELDLSDNRLKDVPASLCNLKDLKILNLKNNKIPFEKIANIIRCLPNTNVLFDEYILKDEAEQEDQYDFGE